MHNSGFCIAFTLVHGYRDTVTFENFRKRVLQDTCNIIVKNLIFFLNNVIVSVKKL